MAKKKEDGEKTMSCRRLPEQRVHAKIITEGIVPYMVSTYNEALPIAEKYVETGEISKDEWQTIYSIVKKLISIYADAEEKNSFCPFNNDIATRYKENHAAYYNAISKNHMKYFKHQIDMYLKWVDSDKDVSDNAAYVAAEHLYFFIACPEKI